MYPKRGFPHESDQAWCTRNALIESFWMHARSLADFYASVKGKSNDDVFATDFIVPGQVVGPQPAQIQIDIRTRVNKQIAHMTIKRETTVKLDINEIKGALQAVEACHNAFKSAVSPQYAGCFAEMRPPVSSILFTHGATGTHQSATNATQSVSTAS